MDTPGPVDADPYLSPIFRNADPDRAVLAVIGLGYVGLPLAVAFARKGRRVVGYDIDAARVARIRAGHDETGEVAADDLREALAGGLAPTADPEALRAAHVILVCVPTPITIDRRPDLGPLLAACATVGPFLSPGSVVVFESTVYPGVTEDVCGPALAAASGLEIGREVLLGYSPERINPGDRKHRVDTIVKVVAGQGRALTEALGRLYGALNGGLVHQAPSIRVAEAAKAIENAQRDINIAFVNEVALICERIGLSVHEVLEAARTKWNFLDFRPGLVGGHCIGVDPYYLSHLSQMIGHEPEVILAGRRLNDRMADDVADRIAFRYRAISRDSMRPRALILGATFKENVPDQRNSKVPQLAGRLRRHGFDVVVHDPHVDPAAFSAMHGLDAVGTDGLDGHMADLLVLAVAHDDFRQLDAEGIRRMLSPHGMVADLPGVWRRTPIAKRAEYWSL
ncbi:nucleotide sugar dehydrogenase [Tistrella mobilis]|uniref:nucleotide sugar dehydrogenase n=1 Tax=Tistrella mobilis TaxID=171437 RepID=UPI003557CB57